MLRQNGIRFYKGQHITFKLDPDLKKYIILWSYSLLNKGRPSILTNGMLRTYNIDKDERIIL